jgi:hypothetical protein
MATNDGSAMPNAEFIAGREQLSDSERAAITAGVRSMADTEADRDMASLIRAMLTIVERYQREVPVREIVRVR